MSWPDVPESPGAAWHEQRQPAGSVPTAGEWVRVWDLAVRGYGQAQSRADRASIWDVPAAEAMAAASARLAWAWRGLLASRPVPHWVSTAVQTAAEVFEEQADAWRARESGARRALQQETEQ